MHGKKTPKPKAGDRANRNLGHWIVYRPPMRRSVGDRRVDRIKNIVAEAGGRSRVREIRDRLRVTESDEELSTGAIVAAIRNENERTTAAGDAAPFRTSREDEEHGWVGLTDAKERASEPADEIGREVHKKNASINDEIRERLGKMDWRTFESRFLTVLLEKLGFESVEITQAMIRHDGALYKLVAVTVGDTPDAGAVSRFINSLSIVQPVPTTAEPSKQSGAQPVQDLGGGVDLQKLSKSIGGVGALLGIGLLTYFSKRGKKNR